MLKFAEIDELDRLHDPQEIVEYGQEELCLDFIDISNYMLDRGFLPKTINDCFSKFAGREIIVCKNKDDRG